MDKPYTLPFKAIICTFAGPTNTLGSRIRVSDGDHVMFVSKSFHFSDGELYADALEQFLEKYWNKFDDTKYNRENFVRGGIKGGYVFVYFPGLGKL
jgi:hypothetical protein